MTTYSANYISEIRCKSGSSCIHGWSISVDKYIHTCTHAHKIMPEHTHDRTDGWTDGPKDLIVQIVNERVKQKGKRLIK